MSKTNCCIVGCTNTYAKSDKDQHSKLVFYSFPSESRFPGRRDKWIAAVNRKNPDGTTWYPATYSRVCSEHFVGGRKRDEVLHPAYIPTIMPAVYQRRSADAGQAEWRFQRMQNRKREQKLEFESSQAEDEPKCMKEMGVQTDFCAEHQTEKSIFLFCGSLSEGTVSCQTNINIPSPRCDSYKETKSTGCGDHNVSQYSFDGYESIKTDDDMKSLTGVTQTIFLLLLSQLTLRNSKIGKENKLLIFLIKMKTGISFSSIGVLFGVRRQAVLNVFVSVLSQLVKNCSNYVYWVPKEVVHCLRPQGFNNNVRSIIDCTEFRCERPSKVDHRVFQYSNYKGYFTLKYLVSITPSGFISFISKGYGGRTSDIQITTDCGFLNLLEKGDIVMADKGFPNIITDLTKGSVSVIMPPFAQRGQKQFSEEQCVETYSIARERIHVERCISRIRTYNILEKIPQNLQSYMDSIVMMCAVLVNLQPPIIKLDDYEENNSEENDVPQEFE